MFLNLFQSKYSNSSPIFAARLPKCFFTDMRDIPGITCAKCGQRMVSSTEKEKILNQISEGSKAVLQRSVFDKYRELEPFKFLLKISEHHPRTSIALLLEDKKNKKEVKKMKHSSQCTLEQIVGISKDYIKKSPQVIRILYKYREGMV